MRRSSCHFIRVTLVLVGLSLLHPAQVDACSTFVIHEDGETVFGRNLDWFTGLGMVVVNKRGVSKTAAVSAPERPAAWISKYGSVTFNQIAREYPFGGINEAGLVVEQMWLGATEYPEPDDRPALGELQWIQYQLDNFRSVAEVIAGDSLVRICPGRTTLHYLICDSDGGAAAIEFIDGEMVAATGDGLPVSVLTNTIYEECVNKLGDHVGFGGPEEIPESPGSDDRFVRAASLIEDYDVLDSTDMVEYAFGILESVAQGEATRWSMVYDVSGGAVHFKTLESPGIRVLHLDDLDFGCNSPVKVLDINFGRKGDVGEDLVDYTTAANRALVEAAFREYTEAGFFQQMPDDEAMDRLATYPETLDCDHAVQGQRYHN